MTCTKKPFPIKTVINVHTHKITPPYRPLNSINSCHSVTLGGVGTVHGSWVKTDGIERTIS